MSEQLKLYADGPRIERLLYSREEAAAMLSISASTLDVAIGRGMLRIVRKGRRVLIHKAELERFSRRDAPSAIWPAKSVRIDEAGSSRRVTVNRVLARTGSGGTGRTGTGTAKVA
jgi:excisionase family DNA binding protein